MNKLLNGRTWNARPGLDKDGRSATEFHVKQVNYLDENDNWQEIDCRFVDAGTHFEMKKATFSLEAPKTARGIAKLTINNRFKIFNKERILEAPFDTFIEAITAEDVPGTVEECQVVYKNAYPQWNADLIYYAQHERVPRLRKLVRFNSPITEDVRISFKMNVPSNVEVSEFDITLGKYKKWNKEKIVTNKGLGFRVGETLRGFHQLSIRIWDSSNIKDKDLNNVCAIGGADIRSSLWRGNKWARINTEVEIQPDGSLIQTKIVPVSFFTPDKAYPIYTDVVNTFFPDADPETTTVDGYTFNNITCAGSTTSLATLRDADPGTGAQSANPAAGTSFIRLRSGDTTDGYCQATKAIFGFDTSSIPDGNDISAAELDLAGQGDAESNGLTANTNYVVVTSNAPATATDLVAGDYAKPTTTAASATFAVGSWNQTDGTYNIHALNSTGLTNISKTGVSWFSTMCEALRSGTAEGAWNASEADDVACYFAETANTTKDPKLIVTHAAPAAGGAPSMMMMGVGG